MPTYVYEVIEENGTAGERFEVDQPMSADPLTTHPMNGKPVRRVITGFRIAENGLISAPRTNCQTRTSTG